MIASKSHCQAFDRALKTAASRMEEVKPYGHRCWPPHGHHWPTPSPRRRTLAANICTPRAPFPRTELTHSPPYSPWLTVPAIAIVVAVAPPSPRVLTAAPFLNRLRSKLRLTLLYPSHLAALTVMPLVSRILRCTTVGASPPKLRHGCRHGHVSSMHLVLLYYLS